SAPTSSSRTFPAKFYRGRTNDAPAARITPHGQTSSRRRQVRLTLAKSSGWARATQPTRVLEPRRGVAGALQREHISQFRPRTAHQMTAAKDPSGTLAGVYILVVEDDEDSRHILTAILRYYGAHVVATTSAEAALTRLKVLRPHVIV